MTSSRFDPDSTSVQPQKPWISPFYSSLNGLGFKTLGWGPLLCTRLVLFFFYYNKHWKCNGRCWGIWKAWSRYTLNFFSFILFKWFLLFRAYLNYYAKQFCSCIHWKLRQWKMMMFDLSWLGIYWHEWILILDINWFWTLWYFACMEIDFGLLLELMWFDVRNIYQFRIG